MAIFFLPGAAGSANFWKPVADRLPGVGARHFFSWPGLGNEPANPKIQSIDDLIAMVLDALKAPVDLVAQSMGGYIAMKLALEAPHMVRRLVLTATSAGVPMNDLGAINWRSNYRRNFPAASEWITDRRTILPHGLARSLSRACCYGVTLIRLVRSGWGDGSARFYPMRHSMSLPGRTMIWLLPMLTAPPPL